MAAGAALAVGLFTAGTSPAARAESAAAGPGSALSPSPSTNQDLLGVSADSAADAWAVGQYGQPTEYEPHNTLTLHWNGTAWVKVPSPDPSGRTMGDNELNAVSALSPTNAWAVGSSANTSAGYNTLILHWNGTAWSRT